MTEIIIFSLFESSAIYSCFNYYNRRQPLLFCTDQHQYLTLCSTTRHMQRRMVVRECTQFLQSVRCSLHSQMPPRGVRLRKETEQIPEIASAGPQCGHNWVLRKLCADCIVIGIGAEDLNTGTHLIYLYLQNICRTG